MTKASNEEYAQLSDERVSAIQSVLLSMRYTESELESRVCPYLAQWLYSKGISIESTCLVISEVINIDNIQSKIDEIYRGEFPPIAKSQLSEFLTKKEYEALEDLIEVKQFDSVVGSIDDLTEVVINFELKEVLHDKIKHLKNGTEQHSFSSVIKAVPTELIVYDSPITEQGRTFRTTWSSNHSNRKFSIAGEHMGATIPEICDYIKNAGFTYAPKLLDIVVACMFNTLIDNGFAEIRTDIDNRGIYFDKSNDKLIPVQLDFDEVSNDEILETIHLLNELHDYFIDNETTLGSVIKWCIMSIFSYAMKQAGNWLPYLYLKGSAGSGKTTLAQIGLYIYDKPSSENTLGGSSFNTDYRIGVNLSKECNARVVNEPASVFNKDAPRETIKVCVESITCRKVHGKVYPAFSPVIFTANQYLPDDDALLRRMYVLSFTHNQRKSEAEKKEFKNVFHVNTPSMSKLVGLGHLGRFAIREMLSDPSRLFDDWQKTADFIINKFYSMVSIPLPGWLNGWEETETLEDFDDSQKESIRNFFITNINTARRSIVFRDDNGYISNPNQTAEDDGSLKDIVWGIIQERMFTWAIPHITRDGTENVCLTQSFKVELNRSMGYSNNLKSLAELLDWDYHNVKFDETQMRVIEVSLDDFMSFVFPTAGSGADEWY